MPTGQLDGGDSSIVIPSSLISLVSVKLTNDNQHMGSYNETLFCDLERVGVVLERHILSQKHLLSFQTTQSWF